MNKKKIIAALCATSMLVSVFAIQTSAVDEEKKL